MSKARLTDEEHAAQERAKAETCSKTKVQGHCACFLRNDLLMLASHLLVERERVDKAKAMRVALDNLMVHCVSLAETGDCGSWEAEEQDEIKQARQAVANFDEVVK